MTTPTTHYEWAERIRQCVYDAVNPVHSIERTFISVGEVTADACECGVLAVSFVREFPSRNFPLDEVDFQAECGSPWLVIPLTISLMRCWPVNEGQTAWPATPTALNDATRDLTQDVSLLRRALECCLDGWYNSHELAAFAVGATEYVGPQGGCAIAETTVQLGFVNGCGC